MQISVLIALIMFFEIDVIKYFFRINIKNYISTFFCIKPMFAICFSYSSNLIIHYCKINVNTFFEIVVIFILCPKVPILNCIFSQKVFL